MRAILKWFFIAIALCFILFIGLVSCSMTYKLENYAHKPTHKFATSMVSWNEEEASKFIRNHPDNLIVIPRMREFSSNFSMNYAFIYFVSKSEDTHIFLKSVAIYTEGKKPMTQVFDKNLTLEMVVIKSSIQADKKALDYPFDMVQIFNSDDGYDASNWNDKKDLTLSVTYSVNGRPEVTDIFELKKYSTREIAWPT